jgi:hypothetical protein
MFVTPTHVVDAARDYAAFGTLIDPSMPGSCCWSIVKPGPSSGRRSPASAFQ